MGLQCSRSCSRRVSRRLQSQGPATGARSKLPRRCTVCARRLQPRFPSGVGRREISGTAGQLRAPPTADNAMTTILRICRLGV